MPARNEFIRARAGSIDERATGAPPRLAGRVRVP